jgi:hypothetical protein
MTGAELNDTSIVSDVVEIDAPAEHVWSVIVDFPSYQAWNPYTFRVDTVLELGAEVLLHLPSPDKPGESFTTLEHMRVIDAPHHLQYDTGTSIPGMLAVRDQWVRDLGEGRCSYQTTDVFMGDIAQMAFDLQGAWVTKGFNATAHALKARAEALWEAVNPEGR